MARNADAQVLNLEIQTPDLDTPEPENDEQIPRYHVDGNAYYSRGGNRDQQHGQGRSAQQGNQTARTEIGNNYPINGVESSRRNEAAPSHQNEQQQRRERNTRTSGTTPAPGGETATNTAQEGEGQHQLPTIAQIMEVQRQRVTERRSERRSDRNPRQPSTSHLLRDKGILPIMPMCFAVVCAVLNFFLPGWGTCCSTFGTCCCNMMDVDPRRRRHREKKCTLVMISLLIGFCQLVLIPFFLIGWIWSCIWGCMYIGLAEEYITKTRERRELIRRMRNTEGDVPEPPPYSQDVQGDQLPIYGYSLPLPRSPPPPYVGPDEPQQTGGAVTVVTEQPQPATVTTVQETVPANTNQRATNHITTLRNTVVAVNFFRSQNPYTRPTRSGCQNDGNSMTPVS